MRSTGWRALDWARVKWAALASKRRLDEDTDAELAFHREQLEQEYLRRGLGAEEAQRRARLELGGAEQIKEATRDARGLRWLETLAQDTRFALRGIRNQPLFSLSVAGTLSLGIGVTATLFTLCYGLIFRALPARDPETLVNVHIQPRGELRRASYGTNYFVSWDEFRSMRRDARGAEMVGLAEVDLSWQGHAERALHAALVSDNLLQALGARPALGRFFVPEECSQRGGLPVVVLGHEFWRNRFHSDPGIVNRTLVLNRTAFTVIGVLDAGVTAPVLRVPDIYVPLTMQPITRPGEALIDQAHAGWIQVLARLRPGVARSQFQAEMQVLADRALRQHEPKAYTQVTVTRGGLLTFPDMLSEGSMVIALLFGAGGMVLLLGCANVANLMLARGLSRTREMAIRLAIGAGRGRLVRQLLTESAVLALLAGVLGVALASLAAAIVPAVLEPYVGTLVLNLRPDAWIIGFAVLLSLLTSLTFGVVPALQALRIDLTPGLRSEGALSFSTRRTWTQSSLVAVQVAACAVLLMGAGLLTRGLARAMSMDIGISRSDVLIASFDLRAQQYTPARSQRVLEQLEQSLRATPGVEAVSVVRTDPLLSGCTSMDQLPDRATNPEVNVRVGCQEVGADYLSAMRIPLRAGRRFTGAEVSAGAPVALVSENLARLYAPGGNVLGKRVRRGQVQNVIVGVVGEVRDLAPTERNLLVVYVPPRELDWMEMRLVVRTRGEQAPVAAAIRRATAAADSGLTPHIKTIEDNIHTALLAPRMAAGFSLALGLLALTLAVLGIYSVVAFTVRRRTKEIGIRMALGAGRGRMVRLMLWNGLRPVFVGLAVGSAAAVAAAQLLRAVLYGLSAADPIALGSVLALLVLVAGLAAFAPSRRISLMQLSSTLRHE